VQPKSFSILFSISAKFPTPSCAKDVAYNLAADMKITILMIFNDNGYLKYLSIITPAGKNVPHPTRFKIA
jgi:hypothetical protein